MIAMMMGDEHSGKRKRWLSRKAISGADRRVDCDGMAVVMHTRCNCLRTRAGNERQHDGAARQEDRYVSS